MHESFFTGPSLPSRVTSQLFFSLYDDRSRMRHCGGRMVRFAAGQATGYCRWQKSLQIPRFVRRELVILHCTEALS